MNALKIDLEICHRISSNNFSSRKLSRRKNFSILGEFFVK
jgi:hypothetical protein